MYLPAFPSFSRRRLTWVSTVRVVTSAWMPQTSDRAAHRGSGRGRGGLTKVRQEAKLQGRQANVQAADADPVGDGVEPQHAQTDMALGAGIGLVGARTA